MLEKVIVRVDVGVAGALLRVLLGLAFTVTVGRALPDAGLGKVILLFLLMLFGIKALAALARGIIPTSQVVRECWAWRRELARYHDSYQWRKLLWFGVGILASWPTGLRGSWQIPLGASCIGSGLIAQFLWRRVEVLRPPPTLCTGERR
jgi:hypothetical protein